MACKRDEEERARGGMFSHFISAIFSSHSEHSMPPTTSSDMTQPQQHDHHHLLNHLQTHTFVSFWLPNEVSRQILRLWIQVSLLGNLVRQMQRERG
jgi:hypothetical protein